MSTVDDLLAAKKALDEAPVPMDGRYVWYNGWLYWPIKKGETMKTYIGVKMVKAVPKTFGDYDLHKDWNNEDPMTEGYLVVYKDGYQSWCPKETFEKANLALSGSNKITQEDVDGFIKETHVTTIEGKTTLVRVVLANGFVLTESSSCVDPANYDEKYGAEICLGKIKDKIWFLLGFLLQSAAMGFDSHED